MTTEIKDASRRRVVYNLTQVIGLDTNLITELNAISIIYRDTKSEELKKACNARAYFCIRDTASADKRQQEYFNAYDVLRRLE